MHTHPDRRYYVPVWHGRIGQIHCIVIVVVVRIQRNNDGDGSEFLIQTLVPSPPPTRHASSAPEHNDPKPGLM